MKFKINNLSARQPAYARAKLLLAGNAKSIAYVGRKLIIKPNGFTLLEVMLSIAVIALISAMMAPVLNSYRVGDDLDIARNTLVQSMRRAQALSQASDDDTTWGVKFNIGEIVVFKGADYAGRDVNYDEDFNIANIITLDSGPSEVVFAKFSGTPSTTGNIQLSTSSNETQTITINQFGMLDF